MLDPLDARGGPRGLELRFVPRSARRRGQIGLDERLERYAFSSAHQLEIPLRIARAAALVLVLELAEELIYVSHDSRGSIATVEDLPDPLAEPACDLVDVGIGHAG